MRRKSKLKSGKIAARPPIETFSEPHMELFGRLADGLGMGVALADPSGMARYANATFFRMLGASGASSSLSRPLASYISPACQREFQLALGRVGHQPAYGEFEVLSDDNRVKTFRVSLSSFDGWLPGQHAWILAQDVTELTEASKNLHDKEVSVRALSGRIMQARDEERRSTARNLHDITGQELAVIMMSLAQISNDLGRPEFDARPAIADVTASVKKIEAEIRTLSYVLHPPLLDELGLSSALSWYADGFSKKSKIAMTLDLPSDLPRLSKDKEIAIFRVVQESLTNVLRHSGSAGARIRATVDNEYLWLYVEDSGRGFPAHSLAANKDGKVEFGVGVLGMRERLQQIGGNLKINSSSTGTQVSAWVPIKRDHSDEELIAEISNSAGVPSQFLHNTERNGRHRILIADDHELMRRGVQTLLAGQTDLEICGEAVDGLEAISRTQQLRPDLVIMDIMMPRVGGVAAASEIRKRLPSTKVLIFTNHTSNQVRSIVRDMGCHGYVSKDRASAELIQAIRAVLAGGEFYDSAIVQAKAAHS